MSELQAAFAAAQLTRLEGIAAVRSRLGNLLSGVIADTPGVEPHEVAATDRSTYWFYMFRIQPDAFTCDRTQFVKALVAEGVSASAGYIPLPMYGNPVFQRHDFFAGRWPIKELGLTEMDYTKVSCPNAELILKTGVRVAVHEGMSEPYIASVGEAVRKVATHFAA
jgi:dTDP-4-amino-4,6-dideoxygalactose transaminase